MKKIFFLFLVLKFCPITVIGQNLIQNGSFEQYNGNLSSVVWLDTSESVFPCVKYWWSGNEAPLKYFNSASLINNSKVPKIFWTFQYPRTGNAYVSMFCYAENTTDREFLETKFIAPMDLGKEYKITYFINSYDSSSAFYQSSCSKILAVKNLGVYFSNTKTDTTGWGIINKLPQLLCSQFLTDTSGWTEVTAYYTAQGGERYMTIGNFNDNAHTPTQVIQNTHNGVGAAFYFIDDVSVEDASGVWELANKKEKLAIIPNPASDILQISFDDSKNDNANATIKIYNSIGQLVLNQNKSIDQGKAIIDISKLSNGYYMVVVETNSVINKSPLTIYHN